MGVGRRGRARRVIDLQGNQRLARDIGNGRLEVLRDGFRFVIVGVAEAGHRQGEGGAGVGDDGSDLHGLSPSAIRKMPLSLTRKKHQERAITVYYGRTMKTLTLDRKNKRLNYSH